MVKVEEEEELEFQTAATISTSIPRRGWRDDFDRTVAVMG